MSTPQDARTWGAEDRQLTLVARNLSTRYLAIAIDGVIGLMMMPFNVAHLGQSAYGLWALTTSITVYFSVLDLGYGGRAREVRRAVPRVARPAGAERDSEHHVRACSRSSASSPSS